jgi:hypothetical protein
MNWTAENIPELRGYAVEWAEPNNFYLSRRNELFHTETLKPPFKKIAVARAPAWKSAASRVRLAQRVFRFMFTNVVALANNDLFVTFDKSVGIVRGGEYLELKNLARPCRVLRFACAVDARENIFFGEYLANSERGAMRIYRYTPGADSLEIAYTFAPGSVRHIHGIYFDSFTDSLVCLTGDDEKECRMLRSFDNFKTLETVGAGDETWRAVSVIFDEDSIYYGMDAEYRANHVYKINRKTGERKSLGEVSGTVFYSKKIGADLFFTTTAENAPSQTENVAALWRVDENDELTRVASFEKDRFHPSLFMFGTIHFPYANRFEDRLYFQLVGVRGDNRTFCAKRD